MNQQEKASVVDNLTVAAEVMGQELSASAMQMMIMSLDRYDYQAVVDAIFDTARKCKFKLTLAEIISRIKDGRPTADEAWQEVYSMSESDSKVMTAEQQVAYCSVSTQLQDATTTDLINTKKAFVAKYNALCEQARDEGTPVSYNVSWGRDEGGRVSAITEAVALGRIGKQEAIRLLPHHQEAILGLPAPETDQSAVKQIQGMVKQIGVSSD